MTQQTDEQIRNVASEILGRELSPQEIAEVRGMCRPGMTCPIAPRILRLARKEGLNKVSSAMEAPK